MMEVMLTKLLPPGVNRSLIKRPRLLKLLATDQEKRINLLSAPAGYGKTVLMLQLAELSPYPLIWYQLDSHDNDPAVFIYYLATGFRKHFPRFGEKLQELLKQGNFKQHHHLLLTAFLNDLISQVDGSFIVLDDYHHITEPLIHQFVQRLLENLPSRHTINIASRTALPFSLSRLELSGALCSIGQDELRFNTLEIEAFLNRRFPEQDVNDLAEQTGGWPAALRLFISAAPDWKNGRMLSANQNKSKFYEYLASEVLEQQPEDVRRFLLVTSVLDVLTPKYCNALLGRADSAHILRLLKNEQLLLTPLAGNEPMYRHHHLFRDFLLESLGEERIDWFNKAGVIACEFGDWERAVEFFALAENFSELSRSVVKIGKSFLKQGRWRTVSRWLDLLPREFLRDDPWLSLFMAQIQVYRGFLEEAADWSGRAVSGFKNSGDLDGMRESKMIQARIERCRGRFQKSLALLDEFEAGLSPGEYGGRFDLPLEKSLCLIMTGRFREAEQALSQALIAAERLNRREIIAHLLEGLGTVNYFLGNYPKALRLYKKGAEVSPDQLLPGYYTQDSISTIYQDWGEFDQAFEYAERNVAIQENFGLSETLPSAYIQLASIYEDRGEPATAERYYKKAVRLIRENSGERFYLTLNLAFLARCLGLQRRWAEARRYAEEALAAAQSQTGCLALGVCRMVVAPIFILTGSPEQGAEMLHQAVAAFEPTGFLKALTYGYTNLAWFYITQNQPEKAEEYTVKALTTAARINFIQYFITYWELVHPVLKLALEKNIETGLFQRILIQAGDRAVPLLNDLANHPDPAVRRRITAPAAEIRGLKPEPGMLLAIQNGRHPGAITERRQSAAREDAATIQPPLRISALGPIRIFINNGLVEQRGWRTSKTRDLLLYLAHYGEPVLKDRIIEDLWPGLDLKRGSDLLYTTLAYLRRVLETAGAGKMIISGNKTYQLLPDMFSSDRGRFEQLIAAGFQNETEVRQSAGLLEQAVSLYRGEYLEDLDYHWLIPEREHLKHRCIEARFWLSRHYLAGGKVEKAVRHLEVLENMTPLTEEVYTLLISAYAKIGNFAEVKKWYQKLVTVFKDELGLAPSDQSMELYKKIFGPKSASLN